jgi:protein N-terminal glutamine amidohydrolase
MTFEPKYQANYCEENIWQLARQPELQQLERFAVFISNVGKCFAMWEQKSGKSGEPVMWDYHVILVTRGESLQIWDLDSTLGYPVAAQDWMKKSFGGANAMPESFHPMFRIVEATTFLEEFSSDRSHMLLDENTYREPIPSWPAIGDDKPANLHRFINMNFPFVGEVFDLDDFTIWLG